MSKILVVEKERSVQRFYERELARNGDIVLTAAGAADVGRKIERARPDLVVLDVGPPPSDGLDIVKKVLAVDRTIPIVLNTTCRSYGDDPLGWAVDAYVLRSTDAGELRTKVRELCSRGR